MVVLLGNLITVLSIIVIISGCSSSINDEVPITIEDPQPTVNPSFIKVASIINLPPQEDYVMVLAHRGGFDSTPENSLSAIQNSIDIGVDIVELDVQISKDGFLVVMHDISIDRTTNGTGLVSDYNLSELKQFKLLMPNGTVSNEFVPSLKEALEFSKGKMHLFIDKGDAYLDLIYQDMVDTHTLDQTFIGGTLTWFQYSTNFSDIFDIINYIPRAGLGQTSEYIASFENGINPLAYFPSCNLISSNNETYNGIKNLDKWMFSTTLVGSNCSEVVLNSESIWNWVIQQGVNGIFTDKSDELINFLTNQGLHDNE